MLKRLSILVMVLGLLMLAVAPMVSAQDQVQVVTFMTTFGGSELDAMNQSLNEFTNQTGIQVVVESNRQLVPILRTRLAGGSPPDAALIPQPGNLAEFARAGYLKPLVNADGSAGVIDMSVLTDNYPDSIINLGKVDGAIYGLLAKANSKSTIWYKPPSFKDLGVEVPQTWDDLMAIQQKYVDAGKTPWSIGGSDNWTLTDWFENIYVRMNGVDKYQQLFATHEIPWTDQSVIDAMNAFKQVISPATNLAGGVDGTLSTDFTTAANLVFRPNPEAEMYFEGGFMGGIIASNFPDLKPIDDFNAFLFPEFNSDIGAPVVGGGDLLAVFADRPEVAKFVQWMAGTDGNTLWAKTGAIVSPNKNVGMDVYSPLASLDASEVANASAFVFDGSDQMPSAVSSQMGTSLQEFVSNPDNMMTQLQEIEDAAATSY